MLWRLMLRCQTIPYAFVMLLANTQSGSVLLHVVAHWGTGLSLIKCPVGWDIGPRVAKYLG